MIADGVTVTSLASTNSNYYGMSFISPFTDTLEEARVYIDTTNGTTTDILGIRVYEQTSGSGLASAMTLLSSTTKAGALTANSWHDVTGIATSFTKNRRYAVMIRNLAGTPASNWFQLRTPTVNVCDSRNYRLTGGMCGWATFNSGSTFSATYLTAMRLKFTTAGYWGLPWKETTGSSSYGVYSSREVGQYFVAPGTFNAIGVRIHGITRTGTPTGLPRLKYYTGDGTKTLVETISNCHFGLAPGALVGYFSAPREIAAGTLCNIVLGEETQSDTSSNHYGVNYYVVDTDSNSLPLIPFSQKMVYYNGSSWADVSGQHVAVGFLLENGDEYPAGGGGSSGIRFPRTFTGL
jgi:hypothetical protein